MGPSGLIIWHEIVMVTVYADCNRQYWPTSSKGKFPRLIACRASYCHAGLYLMAESAQVDTQPVGQLGSAKMCSVNEGHKNYLDTSQIGAHTARGLALLLVHGSRES